MKPHYGIIAATLVLLPLAACAGVPAAPSATPATSAGQPASSAPATSPSTSTPATSASSEGMKTYTLAQVAKRNKQSDCWAAIDGEVYDLTEWISRHPGGPDKIIALCGTDATTAFSNQHDDQTRPNTELAAFIVGDLAD